jgi:hypothetical protein
VKIAHFVLGLVLYVSVELFVFAVEYFPNRAPKGVRAGTRERT